MKILFVGHHMPYYTHTNIYREKAIQELGHELVFFNDRDFIIPGRIRDLIDSFKNWDFQRLNNKLTNVVRIEKPDLCIVMGAHTILPLPNTLKEIKNRGTKIVIWITDIPHPHTFPFIEKTAPFYDYVFCAGTESIGILKNNGIKNIAWLPFGCDPDYHRPVQLSDEEKKICAHDIAFVGAYYQNRWQTLRELDGFDLCIWGPYWKKAAKTSKRVPCIIDNKIDVSEWIKIYNAAKIVMVLHYQDGKTPCYQASPKIYEALACGCFVLVDRQKDAFLLFEDNRHLVGFDDTEDLKEKIRYFLANSVERKEIAQTGRQEVLAHHTYRHRIETILRTSSDKKSY